MSEKDQVIDYSDIPPITDFSNVRRNPYADKIKKHGYTIRIHYSPEDVANMNACAMEKIDGLEDMEWLDLDPYEIAALKKYREANLKAQAL